MTAATLLLTYVLRILAGDTTRFTVEMQIRGAGDTFTLALARHPEYDDRFYRYVRDPSVSSGTIERVDSNLWRVSGCAGACTVRYAIAPPALPLPRPAWVAFLSHEGALIGGPHSFMYVVGREGEPSTVRLDLPAGWKVATSLRAQGGAVYRAASVFDLVDSPILAGNLRVWSFVERGIPHHIAYLPGADAAPFDTSLFVGSVRGLVHQAIALFGRAPYRDFTFLFEGGAYGGLEHHASVSLGIAGPLTASELRNTMSETAHEFFHTWNEVSIHPAGYGVVSHLAPPQVGEMWFSEGATMFYADVLLRRSGGPTQQPTRMLHLKELLEDYFGNAAYARFSLDSISRVSYNAPPSALGDYQAGPHVPGDVMATVLDLVIRDATLGRRSLDDVMRLMNMRFGVSGLAFSNADVERAVHEECSCDVAPLFDAHVRHAGLIDVAPYLALIGLQLRVDSVPNGPDLEISASRASGDSVVRLVLFGPESVWGRAGFHTGDPVRSFRGAPVADVRALRQQLRQLQVGDTVELNGRTVVIPQRERPSVTISESPDITPRQRALLTGWRMEH